MLEVVGVDVQHEVQGIPPRRQEGQRGGGLRREQVEGRRLTVTGAEGFKVGEFILSGRAFAAQPAGVGGEGRTAGAGGGYGDQWPDVRHLTPGPEPNVGMGFGIGNSVQQVGGHGPHCKAALGWPGTCRLPIPSLCKATPSLSPARTVGETAGAGAWVNCCGRRGPRC
ncbi:hypothetical protein [Deinococcus radiodurans]|uniref:hypothetical protein n=1 Tax=Deinococcus radiodurans TaxID=1299 RepID=UPI001FB6671C|nr:hypothetical protein [Deinococcus radiodurans]UTA50342.1 hypothetical protein MSS93_11455 [Deinococcus radiodurans]